MKEGCRRGSRHDVLSQRGQLSEIDDVPHEVSDEEILAHGVTLNKSDDVHACYMLRRFRTTQLLSKLIRGAHQMGYVPEECNPNT